MDIPETDLFIGLIFILILINALFILTEVAIADSHKNQLEKMLDEGKKKASEALKVIDKPTTYLIAVQIGNVSCNILIGDRKSTRLNSSHASKSRMPSSA